MIGTASELFAQSGFTNTSVARLCEHARVNIASVNYHFGSKEDLLRAVLQHTFAEANRRYPVNGESVERLTPVDRVKNHMEMMIRRCFDEGPGGQFDRIMVRLASGAEGLDDLVLEEVTALQANLPGEILAQVIGTDDERIVTQACINVLGLCVGSRLLLIPMRILYPEPPSPEQLDSFIDRQITFALGGLENLKNSVKQ